MSIKKWMSAAAALALAGIMAVSAAAADDPVPAGQTISDKDDEQSAQATIMTEIEPAYIVTVPEDLTVPFEALSTEFGSVELTEGRLEPGKCVAVTLTAAGTLKNAADAAETIPYELVADDGLMETDTVPETKIFFANVGDKTDLKVNITQEDWDNAAAGVFSDTVEFTVSYENDPNAAAGGGEGQQP